MQVATVLRLTDADWAVIKAALRKALDTTSSRSEYARLLAVVQQLEPPAPAPST